MAKNVPDIRDQKFGRWTALYQVEKGMSGEKRYLCRCQCGTEKILRRSSLVSGNSKSCGCFAKDVARQLCTKHGGSGTRLYRIWAGIVQRCCNDTGDYEWAKYGGRGISVCDEWREFSSFRDWALSSGYSDSLSIDRIDNNGNYSPDNCRWASIYEQNNNKRTSKFISYNGETGTIREFADRYGLEYSCLYERLRLGWNVRDALLTPSRKGTSA